jgi:hypothetical protein
MPGITSNQNQKQNTLILWQEYKDTDRQKNKQSITKARDENEK